MLDLLDDDVAIVFLDRSHGAVETLLMVDCMHEPAWVAADALVLRRGQQDDLDASPVGALADERRRLIPFEAVFGGGALDSIVRVAEEAVVASDLLGGLIVHGLPLMPTRGLIQSRPPNTPSGAQGTHRPARQRERDAGQRRLPAPR